MKSEEKKRWLFWGIAALAGVALLTKALAPRPVSVDLEEVTQGPLQVTLDHEGKTRIREPFEIASPVAGRLQRIEFEPGDAVQAGETALARIEPMEPDALDSRDRAVASASVAAYNERLKRSQAEEGRLRAEAELARADRQRAERLAAKGIVSARDLEAAVAEAKRANEALRAAEATSRVAKFELQQARALLASPHEVGKEHGSEAPLLELLAPIDGVVLRRLRQSEGAVSRGELLLEVGNPLDLEVVADYLSTDASRIRPGMTAVFDRWGSGKELRGQVLRGQVRQVEPAGFTKISALGVEEQRVNVIVDFTDPPSAWNSLGDQFRVEVRVVIWETTDALTLSTGCLFRNGDGWAVLAVEGGKARQTPVKIGHTNGRRAEILSGINEGATVVLHPPEELASGDRIVSRSP